MASCWYRLPRQYLLVADKNGAAHTFSPVVLPRDDRFEFARIGAGVPFWRELQALLKPRITNWASLIEQLEMITVTLRGTAYGELSGISSRNIGLPSMNISLRLYQP